MDAGVRWGHVGRVLHVARERSVQLAQRVAMTSRRIVLRVAACERRHVWRDPSAVRDASLRCRIRSWADANTECGAIRSTTASA
jgi:hypothetical protein